MVCLRELRKRANNWPGIEAVDRRRSHRRRSVTERSSRTREQGEKICLYSVDSQLSQFSGHPPNYALFYGLQEHYLGIRTRSNDCLYLRVKDAGEESSGSNDEKSMILQRIEPLRSEASYRLHLRNVVSIIVVFSLDDMNMACQSVEEVVYMKMCNFCPSGCYALVGLRSSRTSATNSRNCFMESLRKANLEANFFEITLPEDLEDILPAIVHQLQE